MRKLKILASDGMYKPPTGEYKKPAGEYFLDYPRNESHDHHFIRGAFMYQGELAGVVPGQAIPMELVPEPGNPYDHWAVAVHVLGNRIGYIGEGTASFLHDYIVGHNLQGLAVTALGEVEQRKSGEIFATVHLPWWSQQDIFKNASGIPQECKKLLGSVPDEMLLRMMINSQDLAEVDAEYLRNLRYLAPTLNWTKSREPEIPEPLRFILIEMDQKRRSDSRDALRAQREKVREEQRAEKIQVRQEREGVRVKLNEEICALARSGLTVPQIMRELRCSEGIARKAIRAAGIKVSNANVVERDKKIARGKIALRLQRAGKTSKYIAIELRCSSETVKDLLRDAKFFEDPASDLERMQKAERAWEVISTGASLNTAAAKLGWSARSVKTARSDYLAMKDHPAENFHE